MTKPRKVVIFTSEFPPGPGGIGNHAWSLARHLHGRGVQVAVYTDSRYEFIEAERRFDKKAPFPVIRSSRGISGRFGVLHRMWLLSRTYLLEDSSIRVIASGKFPLWFIALLSLMRPSLRRTVVLHGSEINFPSGWQRRLSRWSLRRYHHRIAVSRFTADLVRQLTGDLPVTVVPNGFERAKLNYPPNGKLSGDPALITVGSVSPRKGQHNVIKAMPALLQRFPRLQYHVVGMIRKTDRLDEALRQTGVTDRVILHGPLEDAQMVKALKGADVFVMLSENQSDGDVEGFGIAILEANACGLPAIGSKECGIEDAIADGYSGRLVDPHNPAEMLDALQEICSSYQKYSANARLWAERFEWDRIVARYLELLDS